MIPPIVSQFISLVKDTSLATIILLPEATYHAQIIYGQNINYMIPMFVALAVMYFVVNYALSLASRWLDRRLVQSNWMILDISALIAIKIGPRQTNFVWSGPICFSYFAKSSGKSVQMVTRCHLNFKYRQQSVLFVSGYVASPHLAKFWTDLGCCYFLTTNCLWRLVSPRSSKWSVRLLQRGNS